jgi:DNA invertase Pin-like site-specific DNA recombinase
MQADGWKQAVAAYGIPMSCVTEIAAWGESGSPHNKTKKQFARLRELVCTRGVGAVFLQEFHRLSRTFVDAEGLFEDAARNGVWFNVAGQMLNPAEPNDRLVLRMLLAAAEHTAQNQNNWEMDAVYAMARRLEYRVRMPTGLVWADPTDLTYRARLKAANLLHWLDGVPGAHRAVSDPRGTPRYVLPYPNRAVHDAAQLCCRWLLETESLTTVLQRIVDGANGWPKEWVGNELVDRKGHLPYVVGTVWTPALKAVWNVATHQRLRIWLSSPAMAGTYAIYVERLAAPVLRADRRARRAGVHYPRAALGLRAALPNATTLLASDRPATADAPSP